MKFFILLVLLFLNSFCCVFAQNEQTTITSLELNGSNYYDIEIKGFYDIDVYSDKNYGIILDIYKDDIDFEPIFNTIDMKITINKENFLYKLKDYRFQNWGNVYYYHNFYYLEITKEISVKDIMLLMENATIVYKDIDIVKKRGKKLEKVF